MPGHSIPGAKRMSCLLDRERKSFQPGGPGPPHPTPALAHGPGSCAARPEEGALTPSPGPKGLPGHRLILASPLQRCAVSPGSCPFPHSSPPQFSLQTQHPAHYWAHTQENLVSVALIQ